MSGRSLIPFSFCFELYVYRRKNKEKNNYNITLKICQGKINNQEGAVLLNINYHVVTMTTVRQYLLIYEFCNQYFT
jgi:hypothetical protein